MKVVQAILGHASAIETLDNYGHLWPDSEDEASAAIGTLNEEQPVDGKTAKG